MVFRTIVFTALTFVVLGILVLASLPKPNILVAAVIRSDTIETEVSNPSEAEFTLPRAILVTEDEGVCVENVLVRPSQGSTVVYTLEISGDWFAAVDGAVSWRRGNGQVSTSNEGVVFQISPHADVCEFLGRLRLPIAGTVSAGLLVAGNQEAGEGLLPILEGTLTVYGRAVEHILWGLPLSYFERILPLEPGRLYYADTFSIPSGSRMEARQARWWGFIDVELRQQASSMWMHASTNAPGVELFAPAPKLSNTSTQQAAFGADQVSLTLAARIGNDPNLRWLFAIASFFLVLVGLLAQAYSLRRR